MLDIDVDDIREVSYQSDCVRVVFKNGEVRIISGAELPEALEVLNHWTPPTA